MNWDDLRIFLAVCREGSVKQAGERLDISHTTVLRRVRAFEAQLGARLFDRTHSGYAMTQTAEELFGHAVRMEAAAQAIDRTIYGRDAAYRGVVRVTAPFEVASGLIAPALPGFQATYPEIDLHLCETMDKLNLDAREADIAVRLTPRPPEYLIGRKVQPLVQGIYVAPSALTRHRAHPALIVYRGEDLTTRWVRAHFPTATIVLQTDSPTTMMAAARAGLGAARLPCYMADREPGLRRLRVPLQADGWGLWVLTHPDFRSTARIVAVRTFLTTLFETLRPLMIGETSRYVDSPHTA